MSGAVQITVALIGLFGVVGAAVVVALFKNSRNSPEMRTAIDTGWDKLTGGLQRRLDELETSDRAKSDKIAQQELRISHLEHEMGRLHALNEWLTRRVAQLLEFIAGKGLTPPDEEPRP